MKKTVSVILAFVLAVIMVMPSFAANFTPSVEQKAAPSIVPVKDKHGKTVIAVIKDKNGKEVVGIPYGELVVTPVSEKDEAYDDINENLSNAQDQIASADSLADIFSGLDAQVKKIDPDKSASDCVVRDLFDISVYGDYAEYLAVDGNTVTIKFDLGVPSGSLVLCFRNDDGSSWENIPLVDNGDGTYSATFSSASLVAFVVEKTAIDPNGPKSPQTNDVTVFFAVAGVIAIVAGGAILVINRKKSVKA